MRPVPELLKDWYYPCDTCKAQGCTIKRNPVYDVEEAARCSSCGCKGHRLTFDGKEAMDWILEYVDQSLDYKYRLAATKKKYIAMQSQEDDDGFWQYYSGWTLLWSIMVGIIYLVIRPWLGF